MTRSWLDGGHLDGHWVRCPSLVNCRQNATTCRSLYSTYERAKDDRQLFYHLHENGTKHVLLDPQKSWPSILKINNNFRKAFEPDVKLARTPGA